MRGSNRSKVWEDRGIGDAKASGPKRRRGSPPVVERFRFVRPLPRPLAFFCARPTRTALLGPPSVGSFLIPHAKGQGCVLDYCNKQSEGTVMTGGQSVALSNRSDYTTLLFYGIVELAPYNRKTIRINHQPSPIINNKTTTSHVHMRLTSSEHQRETTQTNNSSLHSYYY
jgi:hypothetical protein